MILEQAILSIKPGQSPAFEAAMQDALPLIAATPGFIGIDVRPCLEAQDRYLLLVQWQTLEAHTKGFRGSDRYEKWCALLHHFYQPFPLVEHFGQSIAPAGKSRDAQKTQYASRKHDQTNG